jgi:anti-sigma factor RsiW
MDRRPQVKSKSTMDCDTIREMLEAYVLDALEPEERKQVEQHLAVCTECQRLLDEYNEVVASLPEVLAAVTPQQLPQGAKNRLLQKLEAASLSSSADGDESRGSQPELTQPSAPVAPRQKSRYGSLWMRRRGLQLATIVFGLLLILSIAWSIRLNVALARERALRAEVADLVGQQELVLEVVDSAQTERAVLLPPGSRSDAYGKVFTRSDMPHVVAMAARLPQPPTGQAYHLWLTRDDQTKLSGVMTVGDDGFGLLILEAEQDGPVYDSAQLTLQPLGSTEPSGEPVLVWWRQ